ncbi:class B sortase [Paludicola sp. MB14-C6]|uniref:class B sortase n=1 Tax=Paludihabitans sp. MB14-C6 TaxID=3070656 RepID=UPI0027DC8960|nr:class B sortase [Paludicola sp. MB14-C6]WMJ22127.1 class B sortase [Paludicola sp. MB14-C6]
MTTEKKNSFWSKCYSFWFPQKKDTTKQKIGKIISLVALVILIFSLIMLALLLFKYIKANSISNSYHDLYVSSTTSSQIKKAEDLFDSETGVIKELSQLYKVNNDLIGHINIPNTRLNYPIVKGKDNQYYLTNTLYKKYDPFGVPFADYRSTITKETQSTNITVYGHSAQDGSFFATVKKYKDFSFYQEHPIIEFDTIYGKGTYKIIGFFMEDVSQQNKKVFSYHDFIDVNSDKDVIRFLENVAKRSYFKTGVDAISSDQFITLSTCDTEVNKTDFRVALVARKVREGESTEVDISKSEKNAKPMMPARWYQKKGIEDPFSKER